jgi:hypothetical protein
MAFAWKWYQDRRSVTAVAEYAEPPADLAVTFEDQAFKLLAAGAEQRLTVLHPIKTAESSYTASARRLQVILIKKKRKFWKNLVPRKDPKISVFWDKWVDFDSDENVTEPDTDEDAPTTAVPEPEPPLKPSGVDPSSPHAQPLDHAPAVELDGSEDWVKFWMEGMTEPQRMLTLVECWNSCDSDGRVVLLRHLIELLGDPKVSNKIKGGQEVLADLDASFYAGVSHPTAWIAHFRSLSIEDRKLIFEKLYRALPASEQRLVMGTLSV